MLAHANGKRQLQPQGSEQKKRQWFRDGGQDVANAQRKGLEGLRPDPREPQNTQPWDESWWAVEPGVGRVAYGIPNRVDRLKGLGNAVVPQQVRKAFEILSGLDVKKHEAKRC